MELAVLLLHVFARLDGGDDRGVGGGPADAVLLELLHQARLAEARRRLREVLVGVELLELQDVAFGQRRELHPAFGAAELPRRPPGFPRRGPRSPRPLSTSARADDGFCSTRSSALSS